MFLACCTVRLKASYGVRIVINYYGLLQRDIELPEGRRHWTKHASINGKMKDQYPCFAESQRDYAREEETSKPFRSFKTILVFQQSGKIRHTNSFAQVSTMTRTLLRPIRQRRALAKPLTPLFQSNGSRCIWNAWSCN